MKIPVIYAIEEATELYAVAMTPKRGKKIKFPNTAMTNARPTDQTNFIGFSDNSSGM